MIYTVFRSAIREDEIVKSWTAIWRDLAVAFDITPSKYASGLCNAMYCASESKVDGHAIAAIINPKKDSEHEFWWDTPPHDNDIRATFAGLMAAMGDKGFESFLKWCEDHP